MNSGNRRRLPVFWRAKISDVEYVLPKREKITSQACRVMQGQLSHAKDSKITNPVYKPTTSPPFTSVSGLTPHPRSAVLNISTGISRGRCETLFLHL